MNNALLLKVLSQGWSSNLLKTISGLAPLLPGCFFQTDKDGFVSFLYLDDGTLIMMHKNSELYMRGKIDSRAITKRVNVGTGSVRFDVKKQKLFGGFAYFDFNEKKERNDCDGSCCLCEWHFLHLFG